MTAFDEVLLQASLTTLTLGREVSWHESLPSTQDLARRRAMDGAAEGLLVIADEQTAGRGRQGRAWVSPAGANLYFTLVLRPSLGQLRGLSMALPLAIAEGLEAATGLEAALKWPNDVLAGGKKLCGVLIDAELAGEHVEYALAGVGINVNFDPRPHPEITATATSVLAATGAEAPRELVLAAVLNHLELRYAELLEDAGAVFTAWRSRLVGIGGKVSVHAADGSVIEGIAEDVGPDGSLLLRRADGALERLNAGELRLPAGLVS